MRKEGGRQPGPHGVYMFRQVLEVNVFMYAEVETNQHGYVQTRCNGRLWMSSAKEMNVPSNWKSLSFKPQR